VVHRDVSPQNVLVTEDGVPKLIDFGIAKARERVSKRTSTGVAKGKVAYMSPEQARGERLDRRADLWSVGAMTYELIEGRPLLPGPNDVARLRALVDPSTRPAFSRTPERVAAVLRKALAFRSRDRHESADELRADLERVLDAEGDLRVTESAVVPFCTRARLAAEIDASAESGSSDFGALLPAATANVTVSTVAPSPPRLRRQRARAWLAAGAAATALTVVAIAVGARRPGLDGNRNPTATGLASATARTGGEAALAAPAAPEQGAPPPASASTADTTPAGATAIPVSVGTRPARAPSPHAAAPARTASPPVKRSKSPLPRGPLSTKDDDRID
jgi:serine/threonine-protein kinase